MSEPEDIQKLIRLKRHEQPPVGFIDDFVHAFQQRQRAELLQKSARSLLWERVLTYFDDLMTPKRGWAFATIVALLGAAYLVKPTNNSQLAENNHSSTDNFVIHEVSADTKAVPDERFLISGHYKGGLADEPGAHPQGGMAPVGLRVQEGVILQSR